MGVSKEVKKAENEPKFKRSLHVYQLEDDSIIVALNNVTARQFLHPLLRAAEKELHVKLARHEV